MAVDESVDGLQEFGRRGLFVTDRQRDLFEIEPHSRAFASPAAAAADILSASVRINAPV